MTSMIHRLVVWSALTLLTLVGSACAAYLVSPSALREALEIADRAHCQSRLLLVGQAPPPCDSPRSIAQARDEAGTFDNASAISLQAQGRSIGEAFGPSHR